LPPEGDTGQTFYRGNEAEKLKKKEAEKLKKKEAGRLKQLKWG
jgi:hypothetical protein